MHFGRGAPEGIAVHSAGGQATGSLRAQYWVSVLQVCIGPVCKSRSQSGLRALKRVMFSVYKVLTREATSWQAGNYKGFVLNFLALQKSILVNSTLES